jgi:hypothetical protein
MSARQPALRTPTNPGPAYWIFVPALLLSGFALWASVRGDSRASTLLVVLSALLPALCGIVLQAIRRMTGASICAVIVLAWYWLPPLLLLFLMGMQRRAALMLAIQFSILVIPVGIFALVATISFAGRVGAGWAASAVLAAFIPCLILAGAADRAQRLKYTTPRPADPMSAASDLLAIHKCNQDYSAAHPATGYAESLKQLGPEGAQCLAGNLAVGANVDVVDNRFTIRYEPGARRANGVTEKYSVKAWETAPKSKDWTTLYSDESGLIWYRLESPTHPTRALIEPLYPGYDFAAVLNCVEERDPSHVRIYKGGNDPVKITNRDDYIRNCIYRAVFNSADTFTLDGYEYQYRFSDLEFEVSARPATYGESRLRSFFAVGRLGENDRLATLSVYATPQNRAATAEDPLAMAEEVGLPLSTGVAREEYCGNQLCP